MNRITLLTIFLLLYSIQIYSQDKIYFTNELNPVNAKVIEITQSEIKYKKSHNLDGPIYTTSKNDVSKINFENGTTEIYTVKFERQKEEKLELSSKVFLKYSKTENQNNVNEDAVLKMARREFRNLTNLKLVYSAEEADFLFELKTIKKIMKRKAQLTIKHLYTDKIIYESDWSNGFPNPGNLMSGTRQAVGKVIKKDLLVKYPEMSK